MGAHMGATPVRTPAHRRQAWTSEGPAPRYGRAMVPLLLLAAATLLPADLADDEAFQAGVRHRNVLEYEAALGSFEGALRADPDRPVVERAELLLYAGVLSAELRRFDDARVRFREAVTLVPELTLELDVSPTIRQLFEDVRAEVERERPPPATPPERIAPVDVEAPADDGPLPAAPAPTTAADVADVVAPAERAGSQEAPLSPWRVVAIGTLATGGLVAVGGLVAWGAGIAFLYAPLGADYQAELVRRNAESATLQVAGQGVTVLGMVLLGVGALFLVGE